MRYEIVTLTTRRVKLKLLYLLQSTTLEIIISSATPFVQSKMTEPPFRPREKLIEKQKYFQNIHKHTYLKGPYDKITSVAIPLALAATSLYLIGRGIYNMSHGIGKKE
ncbi:hypothetical protein HKD37_12G034752 [Glycine soja]|nr:uncharacterized protein LOC114379577 isoform X1 [Glycine soja]KAH1222298.1 hypothetical protein GmHk_12G035493 [Glycine max]